MGNHNTVVEETSDSDNDSLEGSAHVAPYTINDHSFINYVPGIRPHNLTVMEYCEHLTQVKFRITNNDVDLVSLNGETVVVKRSLGQILEAISNLLLVEDSTVRRDFRNHVFELMDVLKIENRRRFEKDSKKFLEIYYKRRQVEDFEEPDRLGLKHRNYWGSTQQLRSGKVIGDFVDAEYGPIHEVFGALLNPTTGRVGAGDSGLLHEFLFDDDGPWAFHAAVHDAFGYLTTYHNVGPGYNYLESCTFLDQTNPLSGQLSGLAFWKELLEKEEEKIFIYKLPSY